MNRTWFVVALLAVALSVSAWLLLHPDSGRVPELAPAESVRPDAATTTESPAERGPTPAVAASTPPAGLTVPVVRALGRLAGRVEDRGGIPLRSARVTIVVDRERSGAGVGMEPATPPLDDAAAFALEVPARGRFTIFAEAEAFAPLRVDAVEPGDVVALRLDPAASLGGIVREAESGRPIAGAKISADALSLRKPRETTTAEDGTFALLDLPPGDVRLRAESEDHSDRDDLATSFRPGEHQDLEILMTAGRSIAGRVIATEGGTPIAGAEVQARRRRVRTGEDGRFVLRGLPDGVTTVAAWGRGFARAEVNVTLKGTRTRAEVELPLDAGATIGGQVVDVAGNPLPGATLRLLVRNREATNEPWFTIDAVEPVGAASDAEGRFVLEGVPVVPWAAFGVRAAHQGGAEAFSEPFTLASSKDRPSLRIIVAGMVAVAGRVLDADRKPLAGASIEPQNLLSPSYPERRYPTATSDANGDFVLPGLGEGRFRFRATADGRPPTTSRSFDVDPKRGPPTPIEIQFQAGVEIRGRVVVAGSGEPVAGAKIRSIPARGEPLSTVTDPAGRFSLPGAPLGNFSLVVSASGYRASHTRIAARDQGNEQRIELVREGAILGRVVDRTNRRPLQRFQVQAVLRGAVSPRERRSADREFQDAAGRFSLGVPDAAWDVVVSARGYLPHRIENVVVDATRPATEALVEMAPATWLEGSVVDGDGRPVAGANVHLRRSDAEDRGFGTRVETESDGFFYLGELEAGSFDLAVTHDAYPLAMRERVVVAPDAHAPVAVTLRTETSLVLSLGIPKQYVPAPKNVSPEAALSLALDREGRLVMERPNGRATLRVKSESGAPLALERRPKPGADDRQEFVQDLVLGRSDGRHDLVVKRLPPGSYVLTAAFPGRKTITHRFELLPFREEKLQLEFRTRTEIEDEVNGETPAGANGR